MASSSSSGFALGKRQRGEEKDLEGTANSSSRGGEEVARTAAAKAKMENHRRLTEASDKLMQIPLMLDCGEGQIDTFENLYPQAQYYPEFLSDSQSAGEFIYWDEKSGGFKLISRSYPPPNPRPGSIKRGVSTRICSVVNFPEQVCQMIGAPPKESKSNLYQQRNINLCNSLHLSDYTQQARRIHPYSADYVVDPAMVDALINDESKASRLSNFEFPRVIAELIVKKTSVCDRLTKQGARCGTVYDNRFRYSPNTASSTDETTLNCSQACRTSSCPGWISSVLFHEIPDRVTIYQDYWPNSISSPRIPIMEERKVVRCEVTATRQNILGELDQVKVFQQNSPLQHSLSLWHTENEDAAYSTMQLIEEICDFFKDGGRYLTNISLNLKLYTIPYKVTRLKEFLDRAGGSIHFILKDGEVIKRPMWKSMPPDTSPKMMATLLKDLGIPEGGAEAQHLTLTGFPLPQIAPDLKYIFEDTPKNSTYKIKNILPFENTISIPLEPWRVD